MKTYNFSTLIAKFMIMNPTCLNHFVNPPICRRTEYIIASMYYHIYYIIYFIFFDRFGIDISSCLIRIH